jgi:plastocyanin
MIQIERGSRIKWRATSLTHTVTAYGGNWSFNKTISGGDTVNRKFKKRGTFLFRCRFHSTLVNGVCHGMCGKVRVVAA